MMARFLPPPLLLVLVLQVSRLVCSRTDPPDVSALNVLYTSSNEPSQLNGWKSSGGDPCGEGWKGVTCSGSSVIEINLSGLGLTGTLGYQLSSLTSVTKFDLSKNNFNGDIPFQLPPNAVNINLAGNALTGGIPYSISQMSDLKYLNLANNQLNGQLTDMFGELHSLSSLDLSFNHFSGNLPQSFKSLSSLKILLLQNNQFSGPLRVLTRNSLQELNIQNNQFRGWIPNKLKKIDSFKADGNPWSSEPAPPGMSEAKSMDSSNDKKQSGLGGAVIAGITIAALVVAILLMALIKQRNSASSHYSEETFNHIRPFEPLVNDDVSGLKNSSPLDMKTLETPSFGLKPSAVDTRKSTSDNEFVYKFTPRRSTDPITITTYSLADLKAATESFSSGFLIGEGSIGCTYKGKFADGKVLAIKKIEKVISSGYSSYDFTMIVSGISKLHHPNITALLGHCSEPGNKCLIYEYLWNGSLHGFLHLSDEYSRPLTWDTRVRIAHGTARAIEYLHEICSPSVVHKNIKSANILLETDLNPRLADSGLASFFKDTNKNLGPGYDPPECAASAYTMKSDVYSFGVVMLELLTGRMPFDSSKQKERSLVHWAAPQLDDADKLAEMVDPSLRGLYPPKSVFRFADIVSRCIQEEPELRPAMSEVVQMLAQSTQRASFANRVGGGGASHKSEDSDGFY